MSSDISIGNSPRGVTKSDQRVPSHPLYNSFSGEWSGSNRGPSPGLRGVAVSKSITPFEEGASEGGMKRVTSLDLLSSSLGAGDMSEWNFGHGIDWGHSHMNGDSNQKRKSRRITHSFGNECEMEGIHYEDGAHDSNIVHSDSTADLMALLGQVSGSRISLGSNANIAEDSGNDQPTPIGSLSILGNRARTVSGQSYDGSDFCISPRTNYAENDYGRDRNKYMVGMGASLVADADDSTGLRHSVDISPLADLQQQHGNVFKADVPVTDFIWYNPHLLLEWTIM